MTRPPNILWISTHDIGPHLGAYAGVHPGAEQARTPRLDGLAAEGMRFDLAFAAAPICAPSRSAIMTGCFPTAIGTMHMRTKAVPPPQVRLFSEHLREAGYYATNNWFTDFQVPTPPSAFDDCSAHAHWRNRPTPDTPFFAAFHLLTTHESQIYLDDDAFARRTAHVPDHHRHDPATVAVPPYHPDTEPFRRSWARYHDLITEADHEIGVLLDQLEEDGLADDTVVVFWSDHGPGVPRAKRWLTDAGLHEPLIVRWPGRIAPGSVHRDVVHLMDLAPTTLRLAGVDVPAHMHGTPLLDADGAVVASPNTYAFGGLDRQGEMQDRSRTARDATHRYVRHYHPDRPPMQHCAYPDGLHTWQELRRLASAEAVQRAGGALPDLLTPLQRALVAAAKPAEELYDLVADPHEQHNLAADPAHAATLARFRGALDGWLATYGDLGELDEDDLVATWRPGGTQQVTAEPRVAGTVVECATEGAVVVWTADAPAAAAEDTAPLGEAIGTPVADGRQWRIACPASPPPTDRPVWLKACRLGFQDSAEVLTNEGATTG
ncbi:sulfatase family protein [Pseudonocardia sp. CA-107938]|uniref:sulfatase family protein n=1 Tax=Pseudonocardia sp. CA-107938 TaxID=3240021 RepID=UPI003D93D047